jgi:hypothetical protein
MEPEEKAKYKVRNLRRNTGKQIDCFPVSCLARRRKNRQCHGNFQEKGRRKSRTESILYFK